MLGELPGCSPLLVAERSRRLADLQQTLAKNLTAILNHWLLRRELPPEHTTSRLMLICKKPINVQEGNTLDEFRPIAVTSIFYKLLEVIVRDRLIALVASGTIRPLRRQQCGF